jgi:hypothetical protein
VVKEFPDCLLMKLLISDDNRPPSATKGDQKKGKPDSAGGRSSSVNPRKLFTGISNRFVLI